MEYHLTISQKIKLQKQMVVIASKRFQEKLTVENAAILSDAIKDLKYLLDKLK